MARNVQENIGSRHIVFLTLIMPCQSHLIDLSGTYFDRGNLDCDKSVLRA